LRPDQDGGDRVNFIYQSGATAALFTLLWLGFGICLVMLL
jgi:hypothetical protein